MTADFNDLAGVNVSRETIEKLTTLSDLIVKWTKSINLIAPATVPDIWNRHILDSAQIYRYAGNSWSHWVDLGSGGGLPGLVIAAMAPPDRKISLVESDTRKCLFLNTARRELDLNIVVVHERAEKAILDPADIVSARALASLPDLLDLSESMFAPTGKALFSKGVRYQEELDEALKNWHFDCDAHESLTNPDARILEISRIRRRES